MKPWGGFDHNAQTLRVVTRLEARYAAFDGLNLTWETLEGLVKHNGPLSKPAAYIAAYSQKHDLMLGTYASAEAQVASLADDIAYHSHDLDDGMRFGLFGPDEIAHLPVVGPALMEARRCGLDVPPDRLRHEDHQAGDPCPGQRSGGRDEAAPCRPGAPRCGRHQAGEEADGRVLATHGGCQPRHQGIPARPHVSPLEGQPHDPEGAAPDRGAVRRAARGPVHPARTAGASWPGRVSRRRRRRSSATMSRA